MDLLGTDMAAPLAHIGVTLYRNAKTPTAKRLILGVVLQYLIDGGALALLSAWTVHYRLQKRIVSSIIEL
jgi:hypothetical protein